MKATFKTLSDKDISVARDTIVAMLHDAVTNDSEAFFNAVLDIFNSSQAELESRGFFAKDGQNV